VPAIVGAGFFSGLDTAAIGNTMLWQCVRRAFGETIRKAIMLGRHVYRVHPTEQGWTVMKDGEDHPRGGFSEREGAVAEAVRLAGSDQPAKVTIDNGDGTIAEELLFGTDPVDELGA